jgi:hypothetical protein
MLDIQLPVVLGMHCNLTLSKRFESPNVFQYSPWYNVKFYHDCWEIRFLIGWLPVVNKSPNHGIAWSLFLAFPINYFQLLLL